MRTINWAFIISRSIYDSEIWQKPSDWIKIWIYLLGNVNFQDNHLFKRGEDLFKYDTIARANWVSYKTVENCMKYLRDRNQIGITRTSRGAIISITNYEEYQELSNYKETERKQKGIRKESSSGSIREECNNATMKETTTGDFFEKELERVKDPSLSNSLREWWKYKKWKYKEDWWQKTITIVLKYPSKIVCDRIDEAIASGWQGMNLSTMKVWWKQIEVEAPVKTVRPTFNFLTWEAITYND